MLAVHRRPAGAAALAETDRARIPVAARGIGLLASDYTRSALAAFHGEFFSTRRPIRRRGPVATIDSSCRSSTLRRGAARHAERLAAETGTPSARARFLMSEGWTRGMSPGSCGRNALRTATGSALAVSVSSIARGIRRPCFCRHAGRGPGPLRRLQLPVHPGEDPVSGQRLPARPAGRSRTPAPAGRSTMTWRIGASTGCCADRPVIEVLDALHAVHISGVEVGTPPGHFDPWRQAEVHALRERLRLHEMCPVSIHAPFGGLLDLSDRIGTTAMRRSARFSRPQPHSRISAVTVWSSIRVTSHGTARTSHNGCRRSVTRCRCSPELASGWTSCSR